jgi:spore maturation protein CgeB
MINRAGSLRILVVGASGGSHIGGSLVRACSRLGFEAQFCDVDDAWRLGTLPQKVFWHALRKRPVRLARFGRHVLEKSLAFHPHILITTGHAPVTAEALAECRHAGIRCFNLSTDDPFNPKMHMSWFMRALPHYDIIFSPRRINLNELRAFGCRDVRYLRFGYDPDLFLAPRNKSREETCDLFFAGNAEASRAEYVRAALDSGLNVRLYGNYWERYGISDISKGHGDIPTLRTEISSCKAALCLVRHDNRDGHSMRTFEIPAVGACMVVEDTSEHREIFGHEGVRVVYFNSPAEMVRKTTELLQDPHTRERLRDAAHAWIVGGHNTYADRLKTILDSAS